MVGYTMVSLTLIAQPLVSDTAAARAPGSGAADPVAAGGATPAAVGADQHRLHIAVDALR
jgi:hypothetical protein